MAIVVPLTSPGCHVLIVRWLLDGKLAPERITDILLNKLEMLNESALSVTAK
jgi:hypothetical protein